MPFFQVPQTGVIVQEILKVSLCGQNSASNLVGGRFSMPKNGGICYIIKNISQLDLQIGFRWMLKKNEDDFIQIDAWYFLQMPSICCEALPSLNPTSKLSDKSGNESFSRRWFGEDSMLASTLRLKKAPPSYIPRFLSIMLFWDHELVKKYPPTHSGEWNNKNHMNITPPAKNMLFFVGLLGCFRWEAC